MKLDPHVEKWRAQSPPFVSEPGAPYGLFYIPYRSVVLKVMACDGQETGWDHVSVSLPTRTPNWQEMCFIKDLFFTHEETVVQFHPRHSEYVNTCGTCLHLWKRYGAEHELPPMALV